MAVTAGISETTIYVGGIVEKVTRSGATTWRHRIEGPGGLLAIVNCTGSSCDPTVTTHYVHRDHLGSPELVTNSSGTEVVKLSFGAFGERRDRDWHGAVSSADMTAIGNSTRRGFTEHEHLDSVGLIHMNGRVYDPVLGRFLASDPVADGLGRAGGFNRYAYVHNNPLTLIDPNGLISSRRAPQHHTITHGSLIEATIVTGSGPDRETTVVTHTGVTVTATSLAQSFTLGGSLAWSIATGATFGPGYAFVPSVGGGGSSGSSSGSNGGGGGSDTLGSDPPGPVPRADNEQGSLPLCSPDSVDWVSFGSGALATVSGVALAAGGTVSSLIGIGAIGVPGANVSSPLLIGAGVAATAYGAMNVRDGIFMMTSALDGKFRNSSLGDILGGLLGPGAAETGNDLAAFIAVGSLTRAAASSVSHGVAIRDAIDATAALGGIKEPPNLACQP